MRKRIIVLLFSLNLALAGMAQLSMAPPPSKPDPEDKPVSIFPDSVSTIILIDSSSVSLKNVFDIYWVTNSIKSGWKVADSTLLGAGVEECDTIHPFIMPVIGRLLRGCSSYHAGWDIDLNSGDPVVAGLNGKVRYAKYCSGYGNLVVVRHYSGLEIYYAHLSKIKVKPDQFIEAGDTIGLGGATGRARGSHLHMEFRLCDRALDIADYLVQNDTIVNLYKIFDPPKKQNDPQTVQYHIVARGDNLWDISRRYGTTVNNICALNGIMRSSTLRIGQRLRIQ